MENYENEFHSQLDISTIDVTALEWRDKVNGNSYFAATIVVNYQLPGETTLILPFQYGYGNHYEYEALKKLIDEKIIDLKPYANGSYPALWRYCRENNIILRANKREGCKQRELKQLSAN